jgi:hypothetical protein
VKFRIFNVSAAKPHMKAISHSCYWCHQEASFLVSFADFGNYSLPFKTMVIWESFQVTYNNLNLFWIICNDCCNAFLMEYIFFFKKKDEKHVLFFILRGFSRNQHLLLYGNITVMPSLIRAVWLKKLTS